MTISRKVDDVFAKDLLGHMLEDLPSALSAARNDRKNLSSLIGTAWKVVSLGHVSDAQSPEIPRALEIAADAHVALFTLASNPSASGNQVTYTPRIDASSVNVRAWITGFYFNVILGKSDSIDGLCGTPIDLVRQSSTKGSEYHYLYMESLQDVGSGKLDDEAVKTLLAAIKATDPNRPDIFDPDWTLNLHVPQLDVLLYIVTRDSKFNEALTKAVQLHKKYWEKTKDRRRDYRGMISIELTALAAMGRYRGLSFDVQSPYLAMDLVK